MTDPRNAPDVARRTLHPDEPRPDPVTTRDYLTGAGLLLLAAVTVGLVVLVVILGVYRFVESDPASAVLLVVLAIALALLGDEVRR